jgi:hypothetical protein
MSDEKSKYGVLMLGGLLGGFVLLILKALPGFIAFIAGAALLFFGFGIFTSKRSNNKLAGLVIIIAGALTFFSIIPFLRSPAGWLLRIGAIALFVLGVWSGIIFLLGLRRS